MSTMGTYRYRVQFEADTTQFQSALSNLQNSLSTIAKTPIAFDSSGLVAAKNEAQQLSQILKQATNVNTGKLDISKFSQQLKASGKDLSQYAASLQKLGPTGQQAFMQLAQSIGQAHVPIRTTNRLLQSLGANLLNVAKWQISSTILTGFTSAISSAVQYSKDLNKNLNDIRIVSGESAGAMDAFAEKANKAAKALSTTTNEYAKASLIFYQQGLNAKEVEERAEATIKMANVTGESADSVSSYMTAIWNNFDNGSKSLEYYADVMTALGAATASSTDEIATGLEKFAGIAETVGLSYEYATTALATLVAQTRQSPETVGTALKTIFSRLQGLKLGETLEDGTNLNKYSEALAVVGVNIKDSNGALKDMDQILNDLGQRWNLISKDQQMALAQTVGGIRQYTQLITLMDNWDTFNKNLGTAENAEGELNKQAEIYAESWEAASDRAKASLESLYAQLVPEDQLIELTNLFSGFLDSITEVVDNFGGLGPILLMTFGMLASRFLPQIMAGGMTIVNNMRIAAGLGQKQTQDFIQQAQVEMQKAGMLNQQSQLYQQMLSNTQKILELRNYELENAKSLTSERKREIDAQIEALNQENALLMATEKRKKELEQMQSLTMGQGIMYANQHGYSGSQAKTAMTNLRQDAMFSQYLSEWGMNPDSQNQPFGRNVNGDINTAKDFVRGQGQRLEAGFKDSYGVSTSEVLGYQKAAETRRQAQNKMNNFVAKHTKDGNFNLTRQRDLQEYDKLVTELSEATAAQDKFSEAARNADDAMVKNAENIQKINGLADEEINDLNRLEEEYSEYTNKIVANTEEKLNNSRAKATEMTGDKVTNDTEKNAREEVSNKAPITDPTKPKGPTDQELFNQAQKERSDAMKSSVQGVTSALMGASMAIQAIQSLGSIWSNDDLSIGEKWASTIMSVSMALGGLMSTASGVGQVMKGVATWIQKSGEMAQLSAAMTENADNRQNKSAVKRIKFSLGKAISDASAAAAAGNFAPLMTVIGIGAAIAALIGGGIALTINASKRQNSKEQAEKDYKKASETIETAKNNQELTKSYNELLKTYEETGEGKEELAKQAEQLAEAYNIEGAALANLTGNYKAFTEAINQAILKENEDVIQATKLSSNSLDKYIRSKDMLEKGDGGDGGDVITGGQGKYEEQYDSYVSTNVANFLKSNGLTAFSGSGNNFQISGQNQTELIWQMLQARKLINENAEQLGGAADGLLEEIEEKLSYVDEETLTKVETIYNAAEQANLSTAFINAEDQFKAMPEYDGAIDSVKELETLESMFMSQAEAMGISTTAAKDYFNSLSQFKELRDLKTIITEDYGIVNENQIKIIEALYDEYGAVVFHPEVVPYLSEGTMDEIRTALEKVAHIEIVVDNIKARNAYEKWQEGGYKGDIKAFRQDAGLISDESWAEFVKHTSSDKYANVKYLVDDKGEFKRDKQGNLQVAEEGQNGKTYMEGMGFKSSNTTVTGAAGDLPSKERYDQLEENLPQQAEAIIEGIKEIDAALGVTTDETVLNEKLEAKDYQGLYDYYVARKKQYDNYRKGWIDFDKVSVADRTKTYGTSSTSDNVLLKKNEESGREEGYSGYLGDTRIVELLKTQYADNTELQNIENMKDESEKEKALVEFINKEATNPNSPLYKFLEVAGISFTEGKYLDNSDMVYGNISIQAPQFTTSTSGDGLTYSSGQASAFSDNVATQENRTVAIKLRNGEEQLISQDEYDAIISGLNNATSIADIYNIVGTTGMDIESNEFLKPYLNNILNANYDNLDFQDAYTAFVRDINSNQRQQLELEDSMESLEKDSDAYKEKEAQLKLLKDEEKIIIERLAAHERSLNIEKKIADLREGTKQYLEALEDDDKSNDDQAYKGLAQEINKAYGTQYTGEDLKSDPELLKAVKNIVYGVDNIEEYNSSMLQIYSDPNFLKNQKGLEGISEDKLEALSILMKEMDDVDNEEKLKQVWIKMAELLEKDFSKLITLLNTLMGLNIPQDTLDFISMLQSIVNDYGGSISNGLNATDNEGKPLYTTEQKQAFADAWNGTAGGRKVDVDNDGVEEFVTVNIDSTGYITAQNENKETVKLEATGLVGEVVAGVFKELGISGFDFFGEDNTITKGNITTIADPTGLDAEQQADLAERLKAAKDLYPKLTREFNKYIDALKKGNATQEDFKDFLDAINSENNIEDYADAINKAADAFKVLNDETSSAREKADAREDIADSLDDIFNTDVFDEEFVKNNADAVYGFLEDGTKSPKFKQFLQGYYKKLKEDFEELNLQDTTWISSDGMAVDIPIDFNVNTADLEQAFGSLQGFADQAQAAFDQLTGPEPSTEGLTALIGKLLEAGVSANVAGGMIAAFAASVPGTLTTDYIINIVQRFSQEGTLIDINSFTNAAGLENYADIVKIKNNQETGAFNSKEELSQFLSDNGVSEINQGSVFGVNDENIQVLPGGAVVLSAEGSKIANSYGFGSGPITPPKGTEPVKYEFKGKDFNTAAEETDFFPNNTGSSSKEEPQEPEKKVKKYNAELEKTKAILENIGKEYEKLEKLSDSYLATDEDRLVNLIGLNNNLNEQLDLYNDMKTQADDALPKAQTEMLKWVKEAKFSEADLQYDQEGRIINLPKLIQEMDHKIADAGSGDEQSELEETKGLMQEGIENFNEIIEASVEAEMGILDTSIEISKNNLEQITLPFEIFSRRTEQERKSVETYLGWLEDVNGKSIDRLNYRSKTSLSLLEEYGANEDKINTLLSTGLTTQAQRDALEEALNHKLELRTSLLEEQKSIIEEVGNYLEEHNEYIDRFYDTFDRINSLLDTYKSVMEVIGKNVEEHQAINLKISDTQIKNSQMQLRAAKATKEAAQATYDAVKKAYDDAVASGDAALISRWEEQLWSAEDRLNEAADNFQSAWTDSLDLILERYELAVEQTILRFEDSLSPQKTLDEKNKLYENLLEESDRFLTNEERVYELNKINRQINQEMSKNPNILVQQKLLGIQELINKLKKDEANITDYQLSKLQKIYDLRLAEIALEEAQNNKTQARLVRNSQGNWNYVFTANQDQIDQAAQQLEDARYNYYNNAKEQADKLSKEILDNEKNLSDALKNIKREDYTSEEEYRKALDDTAKYYLNRDAYLRAQMDEALYDSGQSYADSVLGQIEGYESLDAAHQNLETATETAINEMVSHFATFEEEVKNTMTEAGEDYDTFVDKLDTSLDSITSWSETASTNVSSACKTMVDSFQSVIDKAIEFSKAVNLDGMTTEEFNETIKTDSNSAFDKTYNTPSGHANTDYTGLALKLYETYGEDAEKLIKIVNQMRNQKISSGLYDTKDATYMSEEEFLNYVKSNSTAGSNTLGKKIELNLSEEVDNDIQKALDNLIKNSEYFDAVTYSGGTASSGTGESGANTAAGLSASTEYSNIVLVSTGEEVTEDEFYEHLSSPKMQAAFKLNGIQVAFHRGEDGNIYGTYAGQTKTLDVIKGMTEFATAFNPFLGKDVYEALANAQGIVNPAEFYSEEQILRLITGENAGKHIKLQQPNKNLRVALTMNTSDNTIQAYNPDKAGDNKWEFWRDLRGDFGYIDPWQGEGNEEWWKALGIKSFDTGGYTGDWNSSEGRMAMLHEKELILNKTDTKNLLSAVEVLRGMSSSIAGMLLGNAGHQMNGLAKAISVATVGAQDRTLQQQVHIDATFPGVTSAFEIETALNNIINDVSQYAEIKKF